MKKRVKLGQLGLLYSLMIIGVLALIIFMSLSQNNSNDGGSHILNNKGELGSLGIFPMNNGGPCIDLSDTILFLSSSTNSNASLWNETGYSFAICYNNTFGVIYSGDDPHSCKTGNTNKVVGLSNITDALLEIPGLTDYPINVCYGDLICRNVSGNCNPEERAILALSSDTNSHAAIQSDINHPINICCFIPGTCVNDSQCSQDTSKCNNGICVQCLNDSDCSPGYDCDIIEGECIRTRSEPPIIYSVNSSPYSITAVITWNTDENSNSSVNYGINATNFNNSIIDGSLVMSHSLTLSALSTLTTYYFIVTSCDIYGNCATNGTYSFKTKNQTNTTSNPNTPIYSYTPPVNNVNINNTFVSFESKSAEIGKLIEFTISTVGLNQSNLNFSSANLPTGAIFDTKTGKFSWTPSIAGEYTINFNVTDKKLTNIKIVKITVIESIQEPIPSYQTPESSHNNLNYGVFIFWVIISVLIITIIILSILIIIYLRKKQIKNKFM